MNKAILWEFPNTGLAVIVAWRGELVLK